MTAALAPQARDVGRLGARAEAWLLVGSLTARQREAARVVGPTVVPAGPPGLATEARSRR